jgi:hypothetical protein
MLKSEIPISGIAIFRRHSHSLQPRRREEERENMVYKMTNLSAYL